MKRKKMFTKYKLIQLIALLCLSSYREDKRNKLVELIMKGKEMLNRVFLLSFIPFLFVTCNRKNNDNIFEGKYWDILETKSYKLQEPIHCYYFDKNNRLQFFYYKKNKEGEKERIAYDIFNRGEVRYPNEWKLFPDSVIKIMGFYYKYSYRSKDEIQLSLEDGSFCEIIKHVKD